MAAVIAAVAVALAIADGVGIVQDIVMFVMNFTGLTISQFVLWELLVAIVLVFPEIVSLTKWAIPRVLVRIGMGGLIGTGPDRDREKQEPKYDISHYEAIQYVSLYTTFGASQNDEFACARKILDLTESGDIQMWAAKGTPSAEYELVPLLMLQNHHPKLDSNPSTPFATLEFAPAPGECVYFYAPKFLKRNIEEVFAREPADKYYMRAIRFD